MGNKISIYTHHTYTKIHCVHGVCDGTITNQIDEINSQIFTQLGALSENGFVYYTLEIAMSRHALTHKYIYFTIYAIVYYIYNIHVFERKKTRKDI